MKTVIYLDILVLLNLLISYFLLRAAALLTAQRLPFGRALLGAALGACSSLVLLAPKLPLPCQLLYQLACAGAVVWAAFGWQGARRFVRGVLWYFALNALLAGLVLLAAGRGLAVHTNNMAVYLPVSARMLVVCVVAVYAGARGVVWLLGRPAARRSCVLCLPLPGGTLRLPALCDTGFAVQDPFSGRPTVMVSYPAVRAQLAEPLSRYLHLYFAGGQLPLPPPEFRIHLVPCRTALGSGVLPGIPVVGGRLYNGEKEQPLPPLVVLFSPQKFGEGELAALVGQELLTV